MPYPLAACRGKILKARATGVIDINNETGDTSQYSAISGKGTVITGAKMNGSAYGLNIQIDDTTVDYGAKTGLNIAMTQLRVRFYFDPNTLTMANNNNFIICQAYAVTTYASLGYAALLYTTAAKYRIKFYYSNDAGVQAGTTVTITDVPHCIEFYATKASSNVASDGKFYSWIDEVAYDALTNVDLYDSWGNLWGVRIGDVSAPQAGVAGNIFFDELVVNITGDPIGA